MMSPAVPCLPRAHLLAGALVATATVVLVAAEEPTQKSAEQLKLARVTSSQQPALDQALQFSQRLGEYVARSVRFVAMLPQEPRLTLGDLLSIRALP